MSVTEREYRTAEERGASARRGCRPITACPHHGYGARVEALDEAWRKGWTDADRKIRE